MKALICLSLVAVFCTSSACAELLAGTARVDITDRTVPLINDPCYAKALVLKSGDTTMALITVDAVSIGGIGRIGNGFMATVRAGLEKEAGIPPANVIVNASHCHGMVRGDLEPLIIQAVKEAASKLVSVKIGSGSAVETRISENRRIKMKDGSEVDMRRAYPMPRDEDIASIGVIDSQVGLLKLVKDDGSVVAVLYQFACHPIMNPPSKGCSADYPGFASKAIEEALGDGCMAFFIQGCGGDINPIRYKEVSRPADAEPLGTMLGANVLGAVKELKADDAEVLKISKEVVSIPRAADYEKRIANAETEQKRLVAALKPTNINFKAFLPLMLQHKLWPDHPSHHAQSYFHDESWGREGIKQLDADTKALVDTYLQNIEIMERLTRLNTNVALLKKHLAETKEAGKTTMDVEVCGLRVGDFKLVTFPGELTVQIGLNIKKEAPDSTCFVSGYTNGYIFYTPTVSQRLNSGYAQEDCDTLVAPEWQKIFEDKAMAVLSELVR